MCLKKDCLNVILFSVCKSTGVNLTIKFPKVEFIVISITHKYINQNKIIGIVLIPFTEYSPSSFELPNL